MRFKYEIDIENLDFDDEYVFFDYRIDVSCPEVSRVAGSGSVSVPCSLKDWVSDKWDDADGVRRGIMNELWASEHVMWMYITGKTNADEV